MGTPPDIVSANLTPNPGDGDKPRSRMEEERRLKALTVTIIEEAQRRGIQVFTDPGCLDPEARPNAPRSRKLKEETNPKLASFSRSVGASMEVGEIKTRDGDVIKNFKIHGESHTKLALNLQDLANLASRVGHLIGDAAAGLIGMALKVGRARRSGDKVGAGEERASESSPTDESGPS